MINSFRVGGRARGPAGYIHAFLRWIAPAVLSTWILVAPAWAQPDTRIVPLYAVASAVFQTGLDSNVLFTVLNANPNSTQLIQPGDTFTFKLSVAGGSVVAPGAVTTNASGFGASNFSSTLSGDGKQITLTYNGPAAPFALGESFSVSGKLLLTQVTSGFVTLQAPAGGYLAPQSFAASVSGVSFDAQGTSLDRSGSGQLVGPAGPTGPAGATGPAGP